jgi:ribosomal protein S14
MAQKTIHRPHHKDKKVLVKGKLNLKISKSLIIPESKMIKAKLNAKIYENLSSKNSPKDDLCSNCGIRAKGPGFRFLCRYCFRKAGDDPVYSISSIAIGEDIFFPKISG